MTEGGRAASWVWRRSRDCQGQQHLLEPTPTTAKALSLETPGIRGLLCYQGPLSGSSPYNTSQTLGEATHAWIRNQQPLLAAQEIAG